MSTLRRGAAGFSLLETMIALLVLAFGLLAVSGMQIQAMNYANRGRHLTEAAAIAERRMETLQRIRWTAPDVAPTGTWTAPVTVDHVVDDGSSRVEQSYQVRSRVTDLVAGLTRSIDVQVTWDEPDRPNRRYVLSSVRYNREGL